MDTGAKIQLDLFNQTAGQGSGLGTEFCVTAFLEYNTTSYMLAYMNETYLKETVYAYSTGIPCGVVNDLLLVLWIIFLTSAQLVICSTI